MTKYVLRAFDHNGQPQYYVCRPGDNAISPNYRDAYVYSTASEAAAAANYINHSKEDNPAGIWFVRLPYIAPFKMRDLPPGYQSNDDGTFSMDW